MHVHSAHHLDSSAAPQPFLSIELVSRNSRSSVHVCRFSDVLQNRAYCLKTLCADGRYLEHQRNLLARLVAGSREGLAGGEKVLCGSKQARGEGRSRRRQRGGERGAGLRRTLRGDRNASRLAFAPFAREVALLGVCLGRRRSSFPRYSATCSRASAASADGLVVAAARSGNRPARPGALRRGFRHRPHPSRPEALEHHHGDLPCRAGYRHRPRYGFLSGRADRRRALRLIRLHGSGGYHAHARMGEREPGRVLFRHRGA